MRDLLADVGILFLWSTGLGVLVGFGELVRRDGDFRDNQDSFLTAVGWSALLGWFAIGVCAAIWLIGLPLRWFWPG